MGLITLHALVDKTKKRIIFAECNEDFVDVLLSFFTLPMGTIIKLTHKQPPAWNIGCTNNLYQSVKKLEPRRLQTQTCRNMLLSPRSVAASHNENLLLKLDNNDSSMYFRCNGNSANCKLLSYYYNATCVCGNRMIHRMKLVTKRNFDAQDGNGELFVKGLTRLIISDELQVVPSSSAASFSILSKLGIEDGRAIEERSFTIGRDEALKLLKCSLVSKNPLTEVLLENSPVIDLSEQDFEQGSSKKPKVEPKSDQNGKIAVKLMISKSKKVVCYAEAGEDFVDLLFSFLTVPLGFIVKQMQVGDSEGCINVLYDSVGNLDAQQYLVSEEKKSMLLCPKLAPGFSYENQMLCIEEDKSPKYYLSAKSELDEMLVSDETLLPSDSSGTVSVVTIMDPRSSDKDNKSGLGFLRGPALFTVTDYLIIKPYPQFQVFQF